MISLSVKIRKNVAKKNKSPSKKGVLPAVFYGPSIKNFNLEVDLKDFEKIYHEAGESSLISLNVEGEKRNFLVLIHDIKFDSFTGKPVHVDFYQPPLEKEVEVTVPLIFEGISPAVKELGGTLVKNISEIKLKAKPQNLPKDIKVNIEKLKTIEDNIKISDLKTPEGVRILREKEEIIASVTPLEKIEEELVKPIEEKVEEVEKVEKKKEEVIGEETIEKGAKTEK